MKTKEEVDFMATELARLKQDQRNQYTHTTSLLEKMSKRDLIKTILGLTAMLFNKETN